MKKIKNDQKEKYNPDYYIEMFEAIPDNKWCERALHKPAYGQSCALGHCGGYDTDKALALQGLFCKYTTQAVETVNDTRYVEGQTKSVKFPFLNFPTAKARILAALKHIKKQMAATENDKLKPVVPKLETTQKIELEEEEMQEVNA